MDNNTTSFDPHHGHYEHPENSAEYTGLTVKTGVIKPPCDNPYMKPRRMGS